MLIVVCSINPQKNIPYNDTKAVKWGMCMGFSAKFKTKISSLLVFVLCIGFISVFVGEKPEVLDASAKLAAEKTVIIDAGHAALRNTID